MIHEQDVKSPCSRLVYVLQKIVIKDTPFDELNELSKLAVQILQVVPSLAPQILEIQNLLSEQKTHTAFKKGKALLASEGAFLADAQGVQRVG
jgi:flagellar protein FlbT